MSTLRFTSLGSGGAPTIAVPAGLLLTKETRELQLVTLRASCPWRLPSGQCVPRGGKETEKGRNIKARCSELALEQALSV